MMPGLPVSVMLLVLLSGRSGARYDTCAGRIAAL
jgi:hypothetical protein